MLCGESYSECRLHVAMYCGVFVTYIWRFLSYAERKKMSNMTENESDAFEDTDVWE